MVHIESFIYEGFFYSGEMSMRGLPRQGRVSLPAAKREKIRNSLLMSLSVQVRTISTRVGSTPSTWAARINA